MEFDRSKVLTVVTADQARKGQKGWFSNYPNLLKSYVEQNNPDTLKEINRDSIKPFCDGYNHYALFYPAPEPTYAERQAEWVNENNVKEGTRVRFTRNFNKKGLTGTVVRIRDTYLIISPDNTVGVNWCVSFTSFEIIKEPTYRPFKNAEEFKPYREKWVRYKHNIDAPSYEAIRPFKYSDDGIELSQILTWEEVFDAVIFEDGTPFGIKE